MIIDNNTALTDILAQYPWLPDELIKKDARFKVLKTPVGRLMIKNATVADVVKKTGLSNEKLLAELAELIKAHQVGRP